MELYYSRIMNSNKKYIILLFIGIFFCQYPGDYNLYNYNNLRYFDSQRTETYECSWPGLGIIDLKYVSDDRILAGTGGGLGYFIPPNESISGDVYFSLLDSNLPIGGNPALKVYDIDNSKMIIVSGVQTINYDGEEAPTGTGISWSFNNGEWYHVSQPQDASSGYSSFDWYGQDVQYFGITSAAKNVTYDLSVDYNQKYIYAASWAGALRRFNFEDENSQWEIVPLPMDYTPIILDGQTELSCDEDFPSNYIYNPVDNATGNNNHKAFSVHVQDSIIWCGTADGLNKGIIREDGCINWHHYSTDNGGLAGDWVIGFETQDIGESDLRLWAVTWDASIGTPIPHGLTYTDNSGTTWNKVNYFNSIDDGGISESIVYNIYFYNNKIYVSADNGLYVSDADSDVTDNESWSKIDIPSIITDELQTEKVYSVIVYEDYQKMWIGTDQGFITTQIPGFDQWDIPRLDLLNCDDETNTLIAYPNPYYTDNSQNIKFKIQADENYGVIDIFDFSMSKVTSTISAAKHGDFLNASWNGRNFSNTLVSNGTYFCRLKTNHKEYWSKLIIINIK